jgi:hypothetical protein
MTYYELPPDHILDELARDDADGLALTVEELRNQLADRCADIVKNGVSAEKVQLARMLETALLDASRALEAARREQRARAQALSLAHKHER